MLDHNLSFFKIFYVFFFLEIVYGLYLISDLNFEIGKVDGLKINTKICEF